MSDRPAASRGVPLGVSPQSAVPVLLFLVVNRIAGLRWAVIVATLWSIKIIVDRRRQGLPLGVFMPVVTAAVIIRGAIGAVTGSDTLYFGLGIATKYGAAAVLAASVAIGRPLASLAAPHVLQLTPEITEHRSFRPTMNAITLVAGLYYLTSATFDVWLFRRSSVEGFVLVRFLANWPLSAAALIAIAAIAHLRLSRIPAVTSVGALFEAKMAGYLPPDTDA